MEIKHCLRKESRKQKRSEKNKKKQQSWLQRTRLRKVGKPGNVLAATEVDIEDEVGSGAENVQEEKVLVRKEGKMGLKKEGVKLTKKYAGAKRKKSKLEEYLDEDKKRDALAAEYDLKQERMLAKKLKVKKGKFEGVDDILNDIFGGFSDEDDMFGGSALKIKKQKKIGKSGQENENTDDKVEFETEEGTSERDDLGMLDSEMGKEPNEAPLKKCKLKRNNKKKKLDEVAGDVLDDASEKANSTEIPKEGDAPQESEPEKSVKYVPPHLRNTVKNELEEYDPMRRRIRGLLNRISESNVESITGEIFTIIETVPRGIASQIINEEVLTSVADGPRGNEQYAAVFAAFVAGMACLVGIDFGAKLVSSLAKSFENEYRKKDNISLRNLTLFLCYLCILGVFSSDLVYDFLILLSKRLLETDVSTILTILQCCGMKLRSDDPAAMKDFILSVQNRVNEIKSSTGDDAAKIDNRRMEFMLETICEIKNNKKKAKEETVQLTRIKKWLQKMQGEDIQLRGLKWNKLLDPNKKGQWWLPGDVVSQTNHFEDVASKIDKEVLEAQKLIQLASAQGMNTDARKAIFCIIMSGEDCDDAFEKLMRLDIAGKQDREIVRVLVKCCLLEKVFNKYYTVLASKLCRHNKNHKFSLQYCIWDHYKSLDTMELQKSMHLARFSAEMFSSLSLSLAVLKAVDFSDLSQLTPKKVMHFRMLFESIFEYPDKTVWNIFTRIAAAPDLETLRTGIEFFIKAYVVSRNKSVAHKFKVAKKALNNLEGILM
uniref:MI domain-containing protein n=1 Tax=Kalanchoe fedtschenkoi TaxID=63787 RepID=A0A7N0UV83_KALFE